MKKPIFSLFLLCSAMAYSQGTIPIPQVTGLPAALASKVDKVTGKSLVPDTSIVKLVGIQAGAQVNKLEGIQKNGVDLTITGKKVNITVPTTAAEIGAEPANSNIQEHISNTLNPHSVTKTQVGLGSVDNTSDVNKPISSATQTALNGKQSVGTYSTDIHGNITALNAVSGTNTGDETTATIKTKLGITTLSGANTGDQTSVSGNAGTATKLQTSRTINGVAFYGTQNITVNAVDATSRVASSLLGAANGVATLDANGIILTTQLPSYIDDVLEYANLAAFPGMGETGKIYVAKDTNKTYRWAGSVYVYITSGAVDSVNGYTGVVSLSKTDLGLGNLDNTSDANKPISTATQAALNGKQASGTYSTDIHGNITALNAVSGINGGDETLTSIKTKLGAASSSNAGYLTSTDWSTFNSKQPAGSYLTSISSGQVTTALGYTPKPTFTENTAFNKNFGTTTGTVLEGRTFGTAANSAVGDFIQNQNSSAQSANMWIGNGKFSTGIFGVQDYSYQAVQKVLTLNGDAVSGMYTANSFRFYTKPGDLSTDQTLSIRSEYGGTESSDIFKLDGTGAATFSSTVNSTGFLLNGNNLTSNLTTNYIPKWNGSSFVNSLISDDGSSIIHTKQSKFSGVEYAAKFTTSTFSANTLLDFNTSDFNGAGTGTSAQFGLGTNTGNGYLRLQAYTNGTYSTGNIKLNPDGGNVELGSSSSVVSISSTTPSTSPTTGALVVGGGIGVGGKIRVGDATEATVDTSLGSIGTEGGIYAKKKIQAGGEIFSKGNIVADGDVYTGGEISAGTTISASGNIYSNGGELLTPVYQTQTTVNGSTSGNMVCSMPFRTGTYKKVIVFPSSLNGNAVYTFPTAFTGRYKLNTTVMTYTTYTTVIASATSLTITGASNIDGQITIEGY